MCNTEYNLSEVHCLKNKRVPARHMMFSMIADLRFKGALKTKFCV